MESSSVLDIASPTLGHNNPPSEMEIEAAALAQLRQSTSADLLPLLARRGELMTSLEKLRAKIEDERKAAGADKGTLGKDDAPAAVLLCKQFNLLLEDLDTEKKRVQGPFDARVTTIRKVFAETADPAAEAKAELLGLLFDFMELAGVPTVQSEMGQNAIWKMASKPEVVDPLKVPAGFLCPDLDAIREHVADCLKEAAKCRKAAESSQKKLDKERAKAKPKADTIAALEADIADQLEMAAKAEARAKIPGVELVTTKTVVVS